MRPARIGGTSIGAVIGPLYAAGLSADEIEAIFDEFAGSELDAMTAIVRSELGAADILRSGLGNGGVLDSSGFLELLAGHVEARTFEELSIPLSVVATDFWSGEPVIIEQGDLFTAIEASMAVPGLFQPVRQGDRLLVDGGLSKPLPFDLFPPGRQRVVAIDVSGSRDNSEGEANLTDLLFKTFELMQQSIIREMRRRHEPDLYLKPDTGGIRLLHFNRLHDILAGAQPAAETLRRRLLEWSTE
jgi:NTE family protein